MKRIAALLTLAAVAAATAAAQDPDATLKRFTGGGDKKRDSNNYPSKKPAREPAGRRKLTPREAYARTLAATGWVVRKVGKETRSGTCWVADAANRLAVTNAHVVGNAERVGVHFPVRRNGRVVQDLDAYKSLRPTDATVIATDAKRDLALIRLASLPAGTSALKLAARSTSAAERHYSVAGLSRGNDALWGYVDGYARAVAKRRLAKGTSPVLTVVSTAPTNGGNSGGAVVDDFGEVVAVVQGYMTPSGGVRSVSLFVDVTEVRTFLAIAGPMASPRTARDYAQRADNHYLGKRYLAAARDLTRAIAKTPYPDPDLLTDRSRAYWAASLRESAVRDLRRALEMDPKNAKRHNYLGVRLFSGRQYGEARKCFIEALKRDKKQYLYWGNLGHACLMLKQYKDCVAATSQAIKMHDDVAYRSHRAAAYRNLGRLADARTDVERALKLDPKYASALRERKLLAALTGGGKNGGFSRPEMSPAALQGTWVRYIEGGQNRMFASYKFRDNGRYSYLFGKIVNGKPEVTFSAVGSYTTQVGPAAPGGKPSRRVVMTPNNGKPIEADCAASGSAMMLRSSGSSRWLNYKKIGASKPSKRGGNF